MQTPTGEWQVEFVADPDGELAEGDILIDSELLLPAQPELGVGERTRRITTVCTMTPDTHVTKRPTAGLERHRWQRERGAHRGSRAAAIRHESSTKINPDSTPTTSRTTPSRSGAEAARCPVDVKIVSSVDVSREHARIRRDPATGQFFLIDLSTLGTTLNDRHVPRGYDEVDGVKA